MVSLVYDDEVGRRKIGLAAYTARRKRLYAGDSGELGHLIERMPGQDDSSLHAETARACLWQLVNQLAAMNAGHRTNLFGVLLDKLSEMMTVLPLPVGATTIGSCRAELRR